MTDPDRVGRAVVNAQLSLWYPCFICAHKPGVHQLKKHVLFSFFFLFLSLAHCKVNPLILGSSLILSMLLYLVVVIYVLVWDALRPGKGHPKSA